MDFSKQYMKITDTKQLWALEKKSFRGFMIGSIATFIFILIYFIVNDIIKYFYIEELRQNQIASSKFNQSEFIQSLVPQVFSDIIYGIFAIGALVLSVRGIVRSYRNKTFKYIDNLSILFNWFLVFIYIINLIISLWTRKMSNPDMNQSKYLIPAIVLEVVGPISIIILYFVFVRETKFIKFAFLRAEQIEEYSKNVGELGSLFGINLEQNSYNEANNFGSENKANKATAENKNNKRFETLMSMNNEKLYGIAQTLNISGFHDLEKEKLVNLILNILEANEKKKEATATSKDTLEKVDIIDDKTDKNNNETMTN
ncbi:hypothetical protein [Mycoplasmopsis opalescens]|uniref:hypothetical protein n=1 Tax=Mycoplasmopsis opalescens TaxID=114886 RepID=UPI0004A6AAC5|nr:hypothetical protein [Mycoplasmopsis opalescens]